MLTAFLPLFFAIATWAAHSSKEEQTLCARELGHSAAKHLHWANFNCSGSLSPPREIELDPKHLAALRAFDTQGNIIAEGGDSSSLDLTPETLANPNVITIRDQHGITLAAAPTHSSPFPVRPIVRSIGLYTSSFAFALITLTYFALTRLIVRPVEGLSIAARRVVNGERTLHVPRSGVRELKNLGDNLKLMTEGLLNNEAQLKHRVLEVQSSSHRLQEAQEQVVRSERLASVGRLAAGLAHEVGNPLAAMIGLQDLLLSGKLDSAEERDFLRRLRLETERIHHILRDLLQFARPMDRVSRKLLQAGSIDTALHDTLNLLRPQKALQDVELEVDVKPDLPLVALANEQLVQVILNLVLNAADACEGGGNVLIKVQESGSEVTLVIEDTGSGVAASIRPQLFEPFVTTKEVGKGTGLGLAVCRGIIEASGGSIHLDPTYTSGARFVVTIPLATDSAAPQPAS